MHNTQNSHSKQSKICIDYLAKLETSKLCFVYAARRDCAMSRRNNQMMILCKIWRLDPELRIRILLFKLDSIFPEWKDRSLGSSLRLTGPETLVT